MTTKLTIPDIFPDDLPFDPFAADDLVYLDPQPEVESTRILVVGGGHRIAYLVSVAALISVCDQAFLNTVKAVQELSEEAVLSKKEFDELNVAISHMKALPTLKASDFRTIGFNPTTQYKQPNVPKTFGRRGFNTSRSRVIT